MFFAHDRIPHMRAMILADNEKDRRKALKKLLPMQRKDFDRLFKAMEGCR
jgi:pyruvate, orthophosphate dikinase